MATHHQHHPETSSAARPYPTPETPGRQQITPTSSRPPTAHPHERGRLAFHPVMLSISAKLAAGGDKAYLRHLAPDGYEMGVGRQGTYDAHAHLGFTDIAYAPGGLLVHQSDVTMAGKVHVTTPGSWFGPIEFLSDFWFVKFFQSREDECAVPDKMINHDAVAFRGCLVAVELDAVLPLWHHSEGSRALRIGLRSEWLQVDGLSAVGSQLRISR